MLNKIKPLIYFLPLIVVQLVIVPIISIQNIAPNLILILVVYFTLLKGQIYGTVVGFIFGFLFDLFSGGLLGASMMSFTISAFIVGYFYSENKLDTNLASYFFLVILFIGSTINSIVYSAAAKESTAIRFSFLLFEAGILPAIYTTVFGLIVVTLNSKRGMFNE
jgi:rod shape-determining protein MreD